jgi:hypothetical protein
MSSGGRGLRSRRGGATEQQGGNRGVQEDQSDGPPCAQERAGEVSEAGGGPKRWHGHGHGKAWPAARKTGSIPVIGTSRLALLGEEGPDEVAVLPSGPAELGEAGSHGDLWMEEAAAH